MGIKEDDGVTYPSYDNIVCRSKSRGIRKVISTPMIGLIGGLDTITKLDNNNLTCVIELSFGNS